MRIDGPRRPGGSGRVRNGSGTAQPTSGFSVANGTASSAAGTASAPAAIGGVDALLALQSVGEVGGRGERVRHGFALLDILDEMKLDLLSGAPSPDRLERLVSAVARRPQRNAGEAVESVLDEIELRARVELAKLGREAA